MANCYTLISCDTSKYGNIYGVCNNGVSLSGFVHSLTGTNQYYFPFQSLQLFYTVPLSVYDIFDPNGDIQQGNSVTFILRGFSYNGSQFLYTPQSYVIDPNNIGIYECTGWACNSATYNPSNKQTTDYLRNILNTFASQKNIPIRFDLINPDSLISSTIGSEVFSVNHISTHNFKIDIDVVVNGVTTQYSFEYDTTQTAKLTVNGVVVASQSTVNGYDEQVSGSNTYDVGVYDNICNCNSLGTSDFTDTGQTECPVVTTFNTSLTYFNGSNSLEVSEDCSKLEITDTSNYYDNNIEGHYISDFNDYIRIEITKPDGSIYVMSSVQGEDVDETISAPILGHTYIYNFNENDEDGIYTVKICSYPTWGSSYNYYKTPNAYVFWNGKIYKCVKNNTGIEPGTDENYWVEYTGEDDLMTNYCSEDKIVVLCLNLVKCYRELIHSAFCEIESNFCNNDVLCKNDKFLNAAKAQVIFEAIGISVDRNNWKEVESQINILKYICNCK